MADTKISALPSSTTPLAGTEVLPIVQSGATKQVSVANLTAGRAVSLGSSSDTTASSVNGGVRHYVTNTATSGQYSNAGYGIRTYNGSSVADIGALFGTINGFAYQQISSDQVNLYGVRSGGIRLATANSGDIKLAATTGSDADFAVPSLTVSASTQNVTVNSGNLVIGTSGKGLTSTGAMTVKSSSGGANWQVYSSASSTNPVYFVNGSGTVNGVATGANGTAAMLYVNKDSGNLRSINAAGTLNASGADYAEYELKNDACGVISKGQIVGFDADGKLTDKWAQAKSFAVKTTNPSYVGGDTWGNETAIGAQPEQPQAIGENEEPTQEQIDQYQTAFKQYQTDLAAWKEKLEVERQKVDRIAYAGKVPCNVNGAKVGDYIIAVQNGEAIDGMAVEAPTFDQYRFAVGKVRAILSDGRCEIAVIIH